VPDIGVTLKIIIDNKLTGQLLVTGSSSFELANRINEPYSNHVNGRVAMERSGASSWRIFQ
jgi:hypothetical protein